MAPEVPGLADRNGGHCARISEGHTQYEVCKERRELEHVSTLLPLSFES
jgi:hypothetical protein